MTTRNLFGLANPKCALKRRFAFMRAHVQPYVSILQERFFASVHTEKNKSLGVDRKTDQFGASSVKNGQAITWGSDVSSDIVR